MARVESDREDLMAEAVALVRRLELQVPNHDQIVVIGFRANGWLSVYFGADAMYQFDEQGRLRRAFLGGLLYRTQGTTLAQLRRERTDAETTLRRRDLTPQELTDFRSVMLSEIAALHDHFMQHRVVILRQVPTDDDSLRNNFTTGLDSVLKSPEFLAPSIPGKH